MMKRPSLSQTTSFTRYCSLLLQKCMKAKTVKPCQQIHALTLTKSIDMNSFSFSSKLIGTYACCGDLTSSILLFQETPDPNVFAFNWMILALTFSGFHEEAIGYFSLLLKSRSNSSSLNKHTYSVILKGCVGVLDLNLGKQVHGRIYKAGFEMDVSVGNALIDMYGKCREICYARKVFDGMVVKDVVTWTAMICGYSDLGKIQVSVDLFERMILEGVEPNDFTWNTVISGHARAGDCNGAFEIFSQMRKGGLVPDLATWNALISGFVHSHKAHEAMESFHNMFIARVKPNQVTVTGLLPACGMIDSIDRGREIHGMIYRNGICINILVASALIDMYSKCGSVKEAWSVFNTTYTKKAALWNAMIGCYAKHGMVDSAVKLFERMQEEKILANEVTLNSVLWACSHGGLVEKGMEIFMSMYSYGVEANKEHYACIVDLLCRFGRMDEAYNMIKQMPVEFSNSIAGAFLNGCKIHERRDLAEKIFQYLRMELKTPGGFVTLSNIYASEGKWEGVQDVRAKMKDKRVHKKPGFSWF